jgi:hypothetical protein
MTVGARARTIAGQRAIEEEVAAKIDLLGRKPLLHWRELRTQSAVALGRRVELIQGAQLARAICQLLEARRTLIAQAPSRRIRRRSAQIRDVGDDVAQRLLVRQRDCDRAHLRARLVAFSAAARPCFEHLQLPQEIPVVAMTQSGRLQLFVAIGSRAVTRLASCVDRTAALLITLHNGVMPTKRKRGDICSDVRNGLRPLQRACHRSHLLAGLVALARPANAGREIVQLTLHIPGLKSGQRRRTQFAVPAAVDAVTRLAQAEAAFSGGSVGVRRHTLTQGDCDRPDRGYSRPPHCGLSTPFVKLEFIRVLDKLAASAASGQASRPGKVARHCGATYPPA